MKCGEQVHTLCLLGEFVSRKGVSKSDRVKMGRTKVDLRKDTISFLRLRAIDFVA